MERNECSPNSSIQSKHSIDDKPKRANYAYRQLQSFPNLDDFVTTLHLEGNVIKSFPLNLHEYTFLKVLNLRQNHLGLIPDRIDLLVHLEQLDLSNNKLRSLPLNFQNLKTLKKLDISFNQISFLRTFFTINFRYIYFSQVCKFESP
jgi:Leucine-rich repeat (LRR) protein